MIRAALRFPARRSSRNRTSAQASATGIVVMSSGLTTPAFDDPRDSAPLPPASCCEDVADSERSRRQVAEPETPFESVLSADSAGTCCSAGADADDRSTTARRSSTTRCSWACERERAGRSSDRGRGSDASSPDEALRASKPFSAPGTARVCTEGSAPASSAGVASRAPASVVASEPASPVPEAGSCADAADGSATFGLTTGSAGTAGAAGADAAAVAVADG
jgi:hypothetical protein